METRRVANTKIEVTRLSLGCSSLGNLGKIVSDNDADALLDFAWASGIRYFDTAPHYGRGLSETRVGRFIAKHRRGEFVLSTKVGRVLRPGPPLAEADGFIQPLPNAVHYDYTAAGIEESLAASRERLQTDYFDIVYVHDIGDLTHGANSTRHLDDLLSTGLPYLAMLKTEGKIGAFGLGVNENEICIRILRDHPLDVILLAGRWTLLDRTAEAVLVPLCREKGTSIVIGGVFNSGILAAGAKPGAWFDYAPASADILRRTEELERAAKTHGVTLPHAALQFAFAQAEVASVLIGTGKVASLRQNLDLIRQPVPPALARELFERRSQ